MQQLPEKFKQNILSLFPEEAGFFFDSLSRPAVTSVRKNPLKHSDKFEEEETIPWCRFGRNLKQRPSFTLDPLFHAGAYYVQESSSQFLHHIVSALTFEEVNPVVLDICAAPGGKTTTLLSALPSGSLVVANEVIRSRASVLEENCIKWGYSNVLVSSNDPRDFSDLGELFDCIVVDAPCSGEGLFRRDPEAINEWSEDNVNLCTARQERILEDVLPALKPGGFLIYSTCTFNTRENEEQVRRLIEVRGLLPECIEIPDSWGIYREEDFMFRFLPHKVKGEGLFMAVLRKPGNSGKFKPKGKWSKETELSGELILSLGSWLKNKESFSFIQRKDGIYAIPAARKELIRFLESKLYIKLYGIRMGDTDKQRQLIPDHSLALAVDLAESVNRLELSLEEALNYLRKGNPTPVNRPSGWYLATYNGLALGWMKILPNRINNYYPSSMRILKS